MPTENDRRDTQKAMAFDLIRLIDPNKTYTGREVLQIIHAYIAGAKI